MNLGLGSFAQGGCHRGLHGIYGGMAARNSAFTRCSELTLRSVLKRDPWWVEWWLANGSSVEVPCCALVVSPHNDYNASCWT